MRTNITLIAVAMLTFASSLQAQTRFIDPMFEVGASTTITYGQNVDVFLQGLNELEADVYEPVGDDSEALRPIVVVYPTGNFLLKYLNQGAYGGLKDSAAVEIMNRVVSRGYVGMVAEYRTGWLPSSPDQDIRTSTLLQAAYRGGQDAHTMARYLRKSVVEDGNPMRIDTNRIVFWGLGTGGYVTMTHAFLDSVDEVLDDERFYDAADQPYVNISVNADPQGTLPASFPAALGGGPSNIPNHVGYSSDVAIAVNTNGALGDLDWMTGADNEPITLGYHSPSDPFAPFNVGTVIVPTTGDIVISGVSGVNSVMEKANMVGINDAISDANALALPSIYPPLSTVVNQVNAAYKNVTVDLSQLGQPSDVQLSYDNMFPLSVGDTRTATGAVASTYNWIDSVRVRAEIAAFNAAFGQEVDASAVISNEALTNPNAYDGAAARVVFDTIFAHFLPRAYIGMNLEEIVGTQDLVSNAAVGLEVFPNPAAAGFTVRTEAGHAIRTIRVMDINGRVVANFTNVNATSKYINRGKLPRGAYILQVQLDEGTTAQKLILD
ncbi:T9SS type A sorting domain-containing protein [Neolewinella aurantiaca]|uniref:T9SS type A sorting domain-containing protein n=1 Tax=Neolewinella aurantiaca TaxID=2602767 RepID=A0A5C7F2B7_9BACT|nr:T9SS type A sorting domain-containing protein [Neolewinella aurantiaca]TXF84029.1 T9SS type A sorting domain-containing protein [Neolewinella aurantiaca]